MRVRHSTFKDVTGVALRETLKQDRLGYSTYPACEVLWDRRADQLFFDRIMSNYNLVFIVPAPSRKVNHA